MHAAAHHLGLGLSAGRVAATTAAGSLAALRASHLRLEALSQVRKLDEKVRKRKEVAASHAVKRLWVRSLEAGSRETYRRLFTKRTDGQSVAIDAYMLGSRDACNVRASAVPFAWLQQGLEQSRPAQNTPDQPRPIRNDLVASQPM